MVDAKDLSSTLQAEVIAAFGARRPLTIAGGGTKAFYGRATESSPEATLEVSNHCGIVSYAPTELALTARAGTPLTEIEATLSDNGQYLPFEPPHFGKGIATLGGAVAAGLGGPRRPYVGAPRDLVLGIRMLNGRGDDLRFGGEVMKNVAGYDISRLVTGSLGTLGVLLEVSLKVLPLPPAEETLTFEYDQSDALAILARWAKEPLPISGTFHTSRTLRVRLSGSRPGVEAAVARLGGDRDPEFDWTNVRDHTDPFFENSGDLPLWRLALPDGAEALELEGPVALEWNGTLRWLRSEAPREVIRALAADRRGHATLFRGGDRSGEIFQPLSAGLMRVHARMKDAFDPARILNPGRMYAEL